MIRTMRLWRSFVAEKRSGQAIGIDDFVQFRPKGSYTLPCLCCPVFGFNMNARCNDPAELDK